MTAMPGATTSQAAFSAGYLAAQGIKNNRDKGVCEPEALLICEPLLIPYDSQYHSQDDGIRYFFLRFSFLPKWIFLFLKIFLQIED
ncbi:MAG: hypothetical protein MZV63_46180 [Marinilabiliales bacterium]|nr:hypothetical protein [Marinilabiliales bacterium]